MWSLPWHAMFGHSTQATVTETTAYVHETGLFAAHWSYETHGETHRLSCAHIHQTRRAAEDCGRTVNAAVERMQREHKVVSASYVSERLYRNPNHEYLGVYKEEEID